MKGTKKRITKTMWSTSQSSKVCCEIPATPLTDFRALTLVQMTTRTRTWGMVWMRRHFQYSYAIIINLTTTTTIRAVLTRSSG